MIEALEIPAVGGTKVLAFRRGTVADENERQKHCQTEKGGGARCAIIMILKFEFVSDFEFRASDF
jgi:hypothetical protein